MLTPTKLFIDILALFIAIAINIWLRFTFPNSIIVINNGLDSLIFFISLYGLYELMIWSPYFANKIKLEEANKNKKRRMVIGKSIDLIENQKQGEFMAADSKNFVLDLVDIEKSQTTYKEFWWMWPEKHYGQLKLILKNGSIKNFILTEDDYDNLESLSKDLV